jgi:hypothetical protein
MARPPVAASSSVGWSLRRLPARRKEEDRKKEPALTREEDLNQEATVSGEDQPELFLRAQVFRVGFYPSYRKKKMA